MKIERLTIDDFEVNKQHPAYNFARFKIEEYQNLGIDVFAKIKYTKKGKFINIYVYDKNLYRYNIEDVIQVL